MESLIIKRCKKEVIVLFRSLQEDNYQWMNYMRGYSFFLWYLHFSTTNTVPRMTSKIMQTIITYTRDSVGNTKIRICQLHYQTIYSVSSELGA